MKTIIDIEIAPAPQTWVTPLELLEDFADAVPAWLYLEDESRLYAAEKNVPACVIRRLDPVVSEHLDFAFAAVEARPDSPLHLLVVAPEDPMQIFTAERRSQAIHHFLDAFRGYLRHRPYLAEIRPIEAEATRTV